MSREIAPAERRWTLVAASVATFMLLLDVTVVNVALPAVGRQLDASFADLAWVIDAYSLALAALILISGSLADRIGRRRVFVAGLVVFTLASLASGLAGSATALNVARAVQGAGGAAMLATSLALIAAAFPADRRHVALAVWGAVSGVAVAVGPLVGGAIVEALDWRWIFFVNLPVGAGAIALTLARVAESRDPAARRLDPAGALLLGLALGALVLGLMRGNADGWGSPAIVALLVGATALAAAFAWVERRVAAPMVDRDLWRKPTALGASLAVLALGGSAFAMLIFLSLYLQNVLGYGPLDTGLRLLPITVGSLVAAGVVGHAAHRLPARALLAAGLAVCGLGLLAMRGLGPGSAWTELLAGFCVVGLGVGIVNPTVAGAAIGVVETARSGMASGLNSTFRLLGVTLGVAGLGALFEHRAGTRFAELAPAAPEGFADAVATGNLGALGAAPPALRPQLAGAAEAAFVSGLNEILLVAAATAFAGALAALLLVRGRDLAGEPAAGGLQPLAEAVPRARLEQGAV